MPPFRRTQPHFNKLMRRKWLNSPEALDGIVGTLGAQALALRRMQDEPYQVRGLGWSGEGVGVRSSPLGGPLQGAEQPSQGETGGALRGVCGVGCAQGGGLWDLELPGGWDGAPFAGRQGVSAS